MSGLISTCNRQAERWYVIQIIQARKTGAKTRQGELVLLFCFFVVFFSRQIMWTVTTTGDIDSFVVLIYLTLQNLQQKAVTVWVKRYPTIPSSFGLFGFEIETRLLYLIKLHCCAPVVQNI